MLKIIDQHNHNNFQLILNQATEQGGNQYTINHQSKVFLTKGFINATVFNSMNNKITQLI